MRSPYSVTHPSQTELDSLPRLAFTLRRYDRQIEAIGLVDSGASINVLPYELGLELGGAWDEQRAQIPLTGNLSQQLAMPFSATILLGNFTPTELIFAWVLTPNMPLILGQTNFFREFDICFYRSRSEFEIKPKS